MSLVAAQVASIAFRFRSDAKFSCIAHTYYVSELNLGITLPSHLGKPYTTSYYSTALEVRKSERAHDPKPSLYHLTGLIDRIRKLLILFLTYSEKYSTLTTCLSDIST